LKLFHLLKDPLFHRGKLHKADIPIQIPMNTSTKYGM